MLSNTLTKTVFIVVTINLFARIDTFAQSSYELTCRNKAKEIAAETYKNCVTEQRQSQIEQIRKDYKEKMAELKNHYDKELKKISTGKQQGSDLNSETTNSNIPQKTSSNQKTTTKSMRASGARNLPKKTVKTQVIDLTTPSTESTQQPDESMTQSQNSNTRDNENPQDVEIVELPTQE